MDREETAVQAERWRRGAAGAAIGDSTALRGIARALCAPDEAGAGLDVIDACLTALRLASRTGTRPERLVASSELVLGLALLVDDMSVPQVRRARALAAMLVAMDAARRTSFSRAAGFGSDNVLADLLTSWATIEVGCEAADILGAHATSHLATLLDMLQTTLPKPDGASGKVPPISAGRGRMSIQLEAEPDGSLELQVSDDPLFPTIIPFATFDADRLSEKRPALTRYKLLASPINLARAPQKTDVVLALADLTKEMPNFSTAIQAIAEQLALGRRTGLGRSLRLRPMLLLGPPGVEKTRFARALASALGSPFGWTSLAGASDNRELAGTARGWSTAHPSWPVEQLVSLGCGNPILLLDEVDKAGGSERNGKAHDTLLTLLERDTARLFHDDCLGGPIDLSAVNWVLRANGISGLPRPLLSRVCVVEVEPPTVDQVPSLILAMLRDLAAEADVPDYRLLPTIPNQIMAGLMHGYSRHRDPRQLKASIERAIGLAARLEEDAEHADAPCRLS